MKDLCYDLAKYEIEWWKAHHRKDDGAFLENMAKLYQLQFHIPYEQAVESVNYRVNAAKEHDIAEKLEDDGKQKEANIHWDKAEELLIKHFKVLYKK